MPNPGIDFRDPASIKNWAIELANACGGSKIMFGNIKKPNPTKANALLEQFAVAYNTQLIGEDNNDTDTKGEEE
jgi:hypothetical protein